MRDLSRLILRRQFLLSPKRVDCFAGWSETVVGAKYFLYAHPDLPVVSRAEGVTQVVLVGFALDAEAPEKSDKEIVTELLVRASSGVDVRDASLNLGGRWALFFAEGEQITVVNDACGLRQVYYHIEPNDGGCWCGTQPKLLARFVNSSPDWSMLEEFHRAGVYEYGEYWWPTRLSAYRGIERLLPNHSLTLPSGQVSRFWPRTTLSPLSLEQSMTSTGRLLRNLMHAAALRFPLAVTVTAGTDTRTVIACARELADRAWFHTWLLWRMSNSGNDAVIPQRVMERAGYPLHRLPCHQPAPPYFSEIYHANVALAHPCWRDSTYGLWQHYPPERLCVRANCSEVGRCYYYKTWHPPGRVPVDYLLETQRGWGASETIRHEISRWLEDAWQVEEQLRIRALDLFFWEFRLGGWTANSLSEWDIVHEAFSPFNCRLVLSAMLATDERHRATSQIHKGIIKSFWPELLEVPINPRPLHQRVGKWMRKKGKRLRTAVVSRLGGHS